MGNQEAVFAPARLRHAADEYHQGKWRRRKQAQRGNPPSTLLLSIRELSDTKSMSLTYEPYVGGQYGHLKINVQFTSLYRGTSLIRNSAPLETYGHLKSR